MTLLQLRYAVSVAKHKSMNKAAQELYVSQPNLSGAIKDLETEIGIMIFYRTNRGVTLTAEGEEFLGYARQMVEHFQLIEDRFLNRTPLKKKFSVSMQHYSFAVQAFIALARKFGMEQYEFAIHETKTFDVIENVRNQKSELGILYLNEFNKKLLGKLFHDSELEYIPLFECGIYVYLWKGHPLAGQERITFEQLEQYPCLSFEQGENNSFYFAEEVFSTSDYQRVIKVDDRATMLNLMLGLHGFTLCSGIICEDLNGIDYTAVPLDCTEKMKIGYIKKRKMPLSELAGQYIEELKQFEQKIM